MKKICAALTLLALPALAIAQGWPADYDGVMLQGFSWDDYTNTKWKVMEKQADELSQYFSLVWVPQSGNCGGKSMGYNPLYYFDQKSSFGSEEQLRSMIQTFKEKGIGTIADVVINHRATLTNWVDFPVETYKGVTYKMESTDICADDDGGKCKEWADANGYQLSSNNDSGEGWDGFRDLDHNSANVQTIIKAYEDYLLNDLGYVGFRYDVAKGFSANLFGMYNAAAKPQFSVGECWDNASRIRSWINGTKVDGVIQSGAFDFMFRYAIRDALNNTNNCSALNNDCLVKTADYRRYAVTFVENHDMQDRGNVTNYTKDPINDNVVPAAYAFTMSMPGTPCVFQPHWLKQKAAIKNMILLRKLAGIKNTSDYEVVESSANRHVVKCGKLLTYIGASDNSTATGMGYTLVLNGSKYFMYLKNDMEIAWVNVASADYALGGDVTSVKVKPYAVSTHADAQLYYTLDGTAPSATNGTLIESGKTITIDQTANLQVALVVGGEVKHVASRQYTWFDPNAGGGYQAYDVTIHCSTDLPSTWASGYVNFHVWDSEENRLTTNDWPGDKQSETVTVEGKTWFARTFKITDADYCVNVVFNTGSGTPQTVDVTDIRSDKFYVIEGMEGNKYRVSDVTSQYVGLDGVAIENHASDSSRCYDLQGNPVSSAQHGILYIREGKKVIVR